MKDVYIDKNNNIIIYEGKEDFDIKQFFEEASKIDYNTEYSI